MTKQNQGPKMYTIDARGRALGRTASEVATILQGKREADSAPNTLANVRVIVKHIGDVRIPQKKQDSVKYYRHSGFPGGLRSETLGEAFKKNPEVLFTKIVRNMLPANKLRKGALKMIQFSA